MGGAFSVVSSNNATQTEVPEAVEMGTQTEKTILMIDPALWFSRIVNNIIMDKIGNKIEGDIGYDTISLKLFVISLFVIIMLYLIYVLVFGSMRFIKNYPAGKSKELKYKMIEREYTLGIIEYWYDFGYKNESNFTILKIVMLFYSLLIFIGYYLTGDAGTKMMSSIIMIVIIVIVYLLFVMPYNNLD